MTKRAPENAQGCYDLGFDNPAISEREWEWRHLVFVNAFRCGQVDRQNQQPRNRDFRDGDYDIGGTFERNPPSFGAA